MEKYNCVIIDDEPQAIELLTDYIQELNKDVRILNSYTSWTKAVNGLRQQECDILFLDISINGKNGIDLLKLMPGLEAEVIFVTAYSDFALDAIRFSPSGYIVKPVDEIELGITLAKAISRIQQKRLARLASGAKAVEKMGIFNNKGIDYVDLEDIIYFEGFKQYTKIVTVGAEFTSSYHLGKFGDITDKRPFYKVHRSYVVNLRKIMRYESAGVVIMSNKKEIPVARAERNDFLKIFSTIH